MQFWTLKHSRKVNRRMWKLLQMSASLSMEQRLRLVPLVNTLTVQTTANTLTHTAYRIMRSPEILEKLQAELDAAYPSADEPMSQVKLESLPYLTAVIHEGLRISIGVSTRLPRTVPSEGFVYDKYHLPRGTQVGMSSLSMLTDPEIYPSPEFFQPDRWLGPNKPPEKYFVPFSKGSRQCLGMNLAWCELYITIAVMFRRFNFEIIDTEDKDMTVTHDFFNAWTDIDAKKLQAIATSRI